MKINIFKKENSFKKKEFVFNANLYWQIIVGIGLVIIIISFIFSYRLFAHINQDSTSATSDDSAQVPTVNKDRVEKMLSLFSEREETSANIISSPSPVVDPSL